MYWEWTKVWKNVWRIPIILLFLNIDQMDLDIFVFDIQIENVPNASVVRGKIKEKKAWTMTRISLRNLKKLLNREVGG